MKDFIKDGDRITNCSHNVAQMTIWEYLTLILGIKSILKEYGRALKLSAVTVLRGLWAIVALLVNILLFPIYPIIVAVIAIQEAKRDVINHSHDSR